MPFPFIAAGGVALYEWATVALASYSLSRILSENSIQDLWQKMMGIVVEEVALRSGLQLDPENPLSDASFAGAVSQKTGIVLRSLKDRAMIEEDIETHLVGVVSQKSGYQIHSLRNVDVLRADLERAACALLTSKLNIPVGVLPGEGESLDPVAVKERVLAWAKAELMAKIEQEVGLSLADLEAVGDFEALAADMNGKLRALGSEQVVSASMLALQVANKMAVGAVAEYGKVSLGMSKRTRRQLQLRDAQRKFRQAHGNRQKYVPLDMGAIIE